MIIKGVKNPQWEIKRTGNYLRVVEFGDLILGRAKSQQDIDAQIDRLSGESKKKNEISEESRVVEREDHQKNGRRVGCYRMRGVWVATFQVLVVLMQMGK